MILTAESLFVTCKVSHIKIILQRKAEKRKNKISKCNREIKQKKKKEGKKERKKVEK